MVCSLAHQKNLALCYLNHFEIHLHMIVDELLQTTEAAFSRRKESKVYYAFAIAHQPTTQEKRFKLWIRFVN
ncbi:hypothetical protein Bca4012_081067 [Brassica carinata]